MNEGRFRFLRNQADASFEKLCQRADERQQVIEQPRMSSGIAERRGSTSHPADELTPEN
jgi:hypothetical protein